MRLIAWLATAFLLCWLETCWPVYGHAGANSQSAARSEYHLSVGDVVAVMVRGEDELSQVCKVNAAGTISYPLLGDVPAVGVTCAELEGKLRQELSRYLREPQVAVTVREYGELGASVFVMGEVQNPGIYPLAAGAGMMQALAAAGGATKFASGQINIVKSRANEIRSVGLDTAMSVTGEARSDTLLEPGDVIVVARKSDAELDQRYAVLGEVPTPGMFVLPNDREVRVLDAMEKAGLLTVKDTDPAGKASSISDRFLTADLEHVFLTRHELTDDSEVTVPLNLIALLQGDISQNLLLQQGDVLTIPRRTLLRVYALGEVHTPGMQTLPPGSTVLDLLNTIGGVTSSARLGDATILRVIGGKPEPVHVNLGKILRGKNLQENVSLQEGDVLFVPSRGDRSRGVWDLLPLIPYVLR